MHDKPSTADIVKAWFAYDRTKDLSYFWAWEVFFDWGRCDDKLPLVLALIHAAPDDWSLELVGSGPLEDLLGHCGETVIDRIELEAATNVPLRRALWFVDGLWRWPTLESRVRRIAVAPGRTSEDA